MPKLLKIFSILLLLVGLWPTSALAIVTVKDLGGSMFLSFSPTNPKLGDEIIITLSSFISNIDKSNITWSVNEELKLSGQGEKSFSFVLASTTPTNITISTNDGDGRTAARQLIFEPADISIIWETDSFVPFFYDGKRLPSVGSNITVWAFPEIYKDGSKIPNEMLYFTWTYNNQILEEDSGWGQDSVSVKSTDLNRSNIITLSITDPDKEITYLSKTLAASNQETDFVFYESDPVAGLFFPRGYSKSILISGGRPQELTAVPFNLGVPLEFISYNWRSVGREQFETDGPVVNLGDFFTNSEAQKNITFTAESINDEFLPLRSFLNISSEQ